MGQDEEPAAPVRSASLSRSEQARLCRVAQAAKIAGDVGVSHGQVPFDVFAEDPFRSDFPDDPGDLGPKVTRICVSGSATGIAEGLAWITGSDDMNSAAERAAVEGSEIVPDRCRSQGLVCHPRHESGRCVTFPLDESHSAVSGLGDVQAEIEAGVSGAEGDATEVVVFGCEGTKVHNVRSKGSLPRSSGALGYARGGTAIGDRRYPGLQTPEWGVALARVSAGGCG
ncbi:hypothetical protein ABLE43_08465 [Sphingomonas sp. VNH70]